MKNRLKPNDDGFTLIELLVTMLVMAIMFVAMANFFTDWMQTAGIAQAKANLISTAEYALDEANNDILLSGSVDSPNRWPDPNGPGGNQYGWQSNSTTLVLAKVAFDSSGNAIYIDDENYITQKDDIIYYLSGTTLYRRVLASNSTNDSAVTTCPASLATSTCPADSIVATGVTTWNITYYDANNQVVSPANARSIQLSITISTTYNGQPINASYTTRMVFRNA